MSITQPKPGETPLVLDFITNSRLGPGLWRFMNLSEVGLSFKQ